MDKKPATDLKTNEEYELRTKRPDTQKSWGFGKLKVSQFGDWQVGMKVTKELVNLVNSKREGEYINFYVNEPYQAKEAAGEPEKKSFTAAEEERKTQPRRRAK